MSKPPRISALEGATPQAAFQAQRRLERTGFVERGLADGAACDLDVGLPERCKHFFGRHAEASLL